jgi:hypothetical protein
MKKLVAAISKKEIDMDCWIDYYLTIGFDILLYDHNDKPTLKSKDRVTIIRDFDQKIYNTNNLQISFYKYAINTYLNYDWIALLDCDEYLVHDINFNLDDILFECKNFASICPNWVFFGSNGHSHVPHGRVFENFLLRQKNLNTYVKSIVQPKLVLDIVSPHYIHGIKPSVSANMDIMPDPNLNSHMSNFCPIPSDNKIWINHYFCKSKEHWANKVSREYEWQEPRRQDEWDIYDLNEIEDIRCLQLYYKYKKNKIEIVSFIKNEEELIESFILYHRQIADKITIIDNGSTDNTLNIITKYLNDNISLIIDNSNFENKGNICTKIMLESDCDILIPLDADEFLLYDDGSIVKDDPKTVREYLKAIPIDGHKYKINKVYNKIENTNNYSIDKTYNSNKIIFPRLGFVETDCGFHFGKVILDDEKPKINNINISYLHLHYLSKNRWLKSSNQKLKARLSEDFNNLIETVALANTKDKSNHIAKEMIYYLATNKWHNLKHDVSFETPHLTSLFQRHIIPS